MLSLTHMARYRRIKVGWIALFPFLIHFFWFPPAKFQNVVPQDMIHVAGGVDFASSMLRVKE